MRRFEFSDGKSNKFWHVSTEASSLTVTFGRIGTTGQTQTKDLGSPAHATAEMEKLVREKTKKGYRELGAADGAAPAVAPAGAVESADAPSEPPRSVVDAPRPKAAATPEAVPAALASAPWVPARKKPKLEIPPPPDSPPQIVWDDERERAAWADPCPEVKPATDAFAALPPEERDREILRLIASRSILPIYAGRHLSLEAMRVAFENAERVFLAHYRLPQIALAKYGVEVAPDLVTLIDRAPEEAMECLRHVDWFVVAEKLTTKYGAYAEEWYRIFPRTAARLLVPIAVTGAAKDATRALRSLAALVAAGKEDDVMSEAQALGEDVIAELRIRMAPPPLPAKPPALPTFVDLATLPLPALRAGDAKLAPEHLDRLVQLCACLPLDAARNVLVEVEPALDPTTLGDLCRVLLERWTAADAPTDGKWVLVAAALLGDELTVQRMAESVAEWAEQGKHTRVAAGVEALAAAASDLALAHLTRFAEKSKAKSLKKRAAEALEEICTETGMSEDELADRTVPELGLDSRGELTLSYGPRSFRAVFDESLKLSLMSGDKPLRSLPKAAADDDPQLVARAEATWDALKKETKSVLEQQGRRLERAMCRERRWSIAAFERYHLRHPLMQHFARRLVWGAWDASGALVLSFRIAEDRTLANAEDEPVVLPQDRTVNVGLVHPLALDHATRGRWGDVFGDYRIVQPFPQLARETFALDDAERAERALTRFVGVPIEGGRFYSLKHRGWEFVDYDMGKRLSHGRSAVLQTDPGLHFLASKPEDQTLGEVRLHGAASFAALTAIEASELVRDIEMLRR